MSTDGTKPPSITPKKPGSRAPRGTGPRQPGAASGTTGPKPSSTAPASNGTPTDGSGAESAGPPPTAAVESEKGPSLSVGDRLKRAGQGVSDAARSAIPRTDSDHESQPSPVTGTPQTSGGPRRVRLAVAKIDPWSVMKLSFLLSVAIGIMIVVAAAVVWYTLDGMAVFTQVNDTIAEITGDTEFFDVLSYLAFDRVLALSTIIAVVDIVLLTALSTIGAFLYNIVAALVGGIHVTLTDD